VTLNISPALTDTSAEHDNLAQAVVDELTSWNPVQFFGLFKHMHKDAISLVHLNVLVELRANGAMPMGKLAEAIEVSVASTTGIVDRMEKRGFVVRRHDDADRRIVLVEATAAADDVFEAIDFHRREGLRTLLRSLTQDELRGLLEGHRALRAARSAFGAKYIIPGTAGRPATPADEKPLDGPTDRDIS